jgi:phosphatidylglycerophosphate synthase
MATHVNVFLLTVGPARRLFYSEVVKPPDDPAALVRQRGLRGWLETKSHRMKAGLEHSQGAAVRFSRQAWHWLHSRTHPDETLYSRLRSAGSIDVVHPAAMGTQSVEAEWSRFLSRGRRRHWPWLVVNTCVAPLTIVLAPLPGPNLIGYWFVYRAIHHLFILYGLRRVRRGEVEVRFLPREQLDGLSIDARAEGALEHLAALGCDPAEFREFLVRQAVGSASGGRPEVRSDGRLASYVVNTLTAGRLALAGVFPVAPPSWRFPVIVAGGLSDLFDGWIGRRFGVVSTFGQVLDPIADKAFMASVLLTLWHAGLVAAWQLPLVGFRDIVAAGGSAWVVATRGREALTDLPPSLLGKLTTAAQFVFLTVVLYHHESTPYALALATALSVAAGIGYLRRPASSPLT